MPFASLALQFFRILTWSQAYSRFSHNNVDLSMDTKVAISPTTLEKQSSFHKEKGNP